MNQADYWPCACVKGKEATLKIKLNHKTVKKCRVCKSERPDELFREEIVIAKCDRTACPNKLEGRQRYRIWNNAGASPPYREYCVRCGRKIIQYNESVPESDRLKFKILEEGDKGEPE